MATQVGNKITKPLLIGVALLLVMVLMTISGVVFAAGTVDQQVEESTSVQQSSSAVETTTSGSVAEKHFPTYIPEGLKDLEAEYRKANPKTEEPQEKQRSSKHGKVTTFGTVDAVDPGPDEKVIWYQVAAPEDNSIFSGRGWWLPEPTWKQVTMQGSPVKCGIQHEQFEFEGKQYNRPWTRIEWEKDGVIIRVLGINVIPDEVVKMAQSVK